MTWITQPSCIAWYVGAPQQKKTTLALQHAAELISYHRKPCLILDCGGAWQFAEKYHEVKVLDVIDTLWSIRDHCYYTPETVEEVDRICKAYRKAHNAILFVDEAIHVLDARGKCSRELLLLMRTRAHCGAHIVLTTQHLSSDIPQSAFSCGPELYVFRNDSPRSLEVAERNWSLPPSLVSELKVGQYIHKSEGSRIPTLGIIGQANEAPLSLPFGTGLAQSNPQREPEAPSDPSSLETETESQSEGAPQIPSNQSPPTP